MALMASSPHVFPVSNKIEPCEGVTSDNGTVIVDGQGRASRLSLGSASANFGMSTWNLPKVAAFWKPCGGAQFCQLAVVQGGNIFSAATPAASRSRQRGSMVFFQSASSTIH